MKNALALSIVLLLLVVGSATLLYQRVFADPTTVATVPVQDPVTTTTPTTPNGAAIGDGGVPSTNATGSAVDAGVARPPAAGSVRASVTSASGFVEVKDSTTGQWRKLALGDSLADDDSVRTGRNGEARLRLSDGIEVRLSPRSEFTIRELTQGASRVRLEVGHVSAAVDASRNQVLRVEANGSDAVAETKGGEFGMVTDGAGQVAVATTTGAVNLTARGKTVEVVAGKTSTVTKGAEPATPRAMPASLLLKVADPVRRTTNASTTVIEGTTTPGALVQAQDKMVVADKAGRFKVPVRLEDGPNKIGVTVVDALGRQRDVALPEIVVDRKKPEIDAQMTWGGQ
jgi:hypothetical protein